MDRYDVLIIGRGVLGLSVALELARREPDARVAIAGPAAPVGIASRAAGAMLGCFGEVTYDTLATDASRAKFEIGLEAHRRWPVVLETLERTAGVTPHHVPGTHVLLNARSGELDTLNFGALIEALDSYDERWEEVDPRDVPGLRPVPDSRPLRAVLLPDEGAVDGNQVLGMLELAVAALGVGFIDDHVSALAEQDGSLGARLASVGAIGAGQIVVAAGAWSASLLRTLLPLDGVLPMFAGAGVACVGRRVAGEPFSTVVRTPNRSGSCGLHLIPLPAGREYIGATNVVFAEPELHGHAGIQHALVGYAMDQLDEAIFFHRVEQWRIGNRPITLDGFPAVGATAAEGLFVITGTYRDGFHCSPVLAEYLVDEMLGAVSALPPCFAPTRRPLFTRTVDEAVADYVLHSSAGWFEESGVVPRHLTTGLLAEAFEPMVRALHADVGLDVGLAPEILIHLLDSRATPEVAEGLVAYLSAVA